MEPPQDVRLVERSAGIAWDEGDGIVRMKIRKRHIDLAASRDLAEALLEVRGDRRLPLVVDTSVVRSSSFKAREWGASPEVVQTVSCVAFLVGGPISRVIASFFMGFNRPIYPTRVFDKEQEAIAWARTHGATPSSES